MNSPEPAATPTPAPVTPDTKDAGAAGRRHLINFCAVGVGASFFLPWIPFFFVKPSGFDLTKAGDSAKLLWLMPVLAAVTLVAGFTGKSQRVAGQLAGACPFVILIYGLIKLGSDLLKALEPGAWLGLAVGAALFIVARR